jgi:hypothetical protein
MRTHHMSIIGSPSVAMKMLPLKTNVNSTVPFTNQQSIKTADALSSSERLLDAFDMKFEYSSTNADAADWLLNDKFPALNTIIGTELIIDDCLAKTADELTNEIDKMLGCDTNSNTSILNIKSRSFSSTSTSSSSMSSSHIAYLDENVFKEEEKNDENEKNLNYMLISKRGSSLLKKPETKSESGGGCIVGIDEQAECAENDFLQTSKMVDSLIEDIENELLLKSDSDTHAHSQSQSRARSHSSRPQSGSLSSSYRSRSSSHAAALMTAFLMTPTNRSCRCKKTCNCACHIGLTRTCSNNSLEWDVSIDELEQASGNQEHMK